MRAVLFSFVAILFIASVAFAQTRDSSYIAYVTIGAASINGEAWDTSMGAEPAACSVISYTSEGSYWPIPPISSPEDSYVKTYSFEFMPELSASVWLKTNVTPQFRLTEYPSNDLGDDGTNNLSLFRMYNTTVLLQDRADLLLLQMNLTYDDLAVNASGFEPGTLAWYSWQPYVGYNGRWVREPSLVDQKTHAISAMVNHTGVFAIFGVRRSAFFDVDGIRAQMQLLAQDREYLLGVLAVVAIVVTYLVYRLRKKKKSKPTPAPTYE